MISQEVVRDFYEFSDEMFIATLSRIPSEVRKERLSKIIILLIFWCKLISGMEILFLFLLMMKQFMAGAPFVCGSLSD